jgi:hypothetical protein
MKSCLLGFPGLVASLVLVSSVGLLSNAEAADGYTGKWLGSGYSNVLKKSGTASGTIRQNGKKISGTFRLNISKTVAKEKDCPTSAKFVGAVSSSGFNGSLFGASDFEARLSGKLKIAKLTGTYRITGGGCAGDSGTFSMKK